MRGDTVARKCQALHFAAQTLPLPAAPASLPSKRCCCLCSRRINKIPADTALYVADELRDAESVGVVELRDAESVGEAFSHEISLNTQTYSVR